VTEDKCRLHRVMLMVRDETARILDGLSLADTIPADQFGLDLLEADGHDAEAMSQPG
jgi:DNA-binding IscR family transcriptional regulator